MSSYFDHFMITKLFSLFFSDYFLILICVLLIYNLMLKNYFMVPSNFQLLMEGVYSHWLENVKENLGEEYKFFTFPLFSLFIFMFGLNLLGFFMFNFSPTTHMFFTFGFSFLSWLGVMIFGVLNHGSSFFSMFMPSGAPLSFSPLLILIELASHLSSPMALGMSLAANLTAGHILLTILSDFGSKMLFFSWSFYNLFPMLMMVFMIILEIGVLIIQAYVFTLLVMIYLKDSLMLH